MEWRREQRETKTTKFGIRSSSFSDFFFVVYLNEPFISDYMPGRKTWRENGRERSPEGSNEVGGGERNEKDEEGTKRFKTLPVFSYEPETRWISERWNKRNEK